MKTLTVVLIMFSFSVLSVARDKGTATKVEIQEVQEYTGATHGWGGVSTFTGAYRMKAVLNGEKVLLECWNRPQNCTYLGIQVYDGRVRGSDIWITFEVPVSHKQKQDHWRIIGSW
jgi:hypothetical protein